MRTIPGMQPFDATDAAILRELREIQSRIDPCPAGLAEQITFALTVQALQAEVAELTSAAGVLTRAAVEDADEAARVPNHDQMLASVRTKALLLAFAVDETYGLMRQIERDPESLG